MPNLTINPNVFLSPVENGYVAFDVVEEKLYELNPIASLLAELCDGSRTVDDVTALVQPLVPLEAADSIPAWLLEAEQNGLLVRVTAALVGRHDRDLGAEELAELSHRLRDEGKTQAAFLCQQRAVELAPDNAQFWCHLGELSHIVGKRAAARDAYQRYLQFEPDDAEVQHLLVALRDQSPPSRVPDECIRHLYSRFSTYYEANMCDELGYQGPQHLLDVVRRTLGDRRELSVLDLGCGTGLAGQVLRPFAARLVGVDLSGAMLAKARARRIYDELAVGELTEWLNATEQSLDLVVACDTFIYFGDLRQTIGPAKQKLNRGGAIAFSVEKAETPPFRLTDSGRYEHHIDHLRDAAAAFQLQIANHREAFLRMEYGEEVHGHFVCLA